MNVLSLGKLYRLTSLRRMPTRFILCIVCCLNFSIGESQFRNKSLQRKSKARGKRLDILNQDSGKRFVSITSRTNIPSNQNSKGWLTDLPLSATSEKYGLAAKLGLSDGDLRAKASYGNDFGRPSQKKDNNNNDKKKSERTKPSEKENENITEDRMNPTVCNLNSNAEKNDGEKAAFANWDPTLVCNGCWKPDISTSIRPTRVTTNKLVASHASDGNNGNRSQYAGWVINYPSRDLEPGKPTSSWTTGATTNNQISSHTTQGGLLEESVSEKSEEIPFFNVSSSFTAEFGGRMDVTVIGCNMLFVIVAIVFNCTMSSFYRSQIKKLIPFIYFTVSITDLITALSCLSHPVILALVMFTDQTMLSSVVILLFYSICSTSIRSGVFYNLVLSVVRSVNIVHPFYQIKLKWVKTACLLCPILWCLVVLYDVYWVLMLGYLNHPAALFKYMIYMPMAGSGAATTFLGPNASYLELILFGMTVPFLVPAVIVIICLIFQVYYLSVSKVEVRSSQKIVSRRPAITIFQLTLLFVVCNLSATGVYTYYFLPSGREQRRTEVHEARLMYLSSCVLHVINAAFSPMIMILRGRSLKKAITSEFTYIRSRLSTKSASSGSRFNGVKAVIYKY